MIDILFKKKTYNWIMVESLEIKWWKLFKGNKIDHITWGPNLSTTAMSRRSI